MFIDPFSRNASHANAMPRLRVGDGGSAGAAERRCKGNFSPIAAL
jgi:hypothetical protein